MLMIAWEGKVKKDNQSKVVLFRDVRIVCKSLYVFLILTGM